MQPDLWKKVEELYQAARAQPREKRAAFLAHACPHDPRLRGEVQSMLDQQSDNLESATLSAARVLAAGVKLGKFEIVGLLGRGGMGEVWRARDPRLKREVAIKVLPAMFASDRDCVARFEREARAASALNHTNIVTVYDVGQEDGVSFIVSELVEGETLAVAIERGPLPLRRLIDVATQIADGLVAAHAAGIVHRDLKPGNVMLTSGGRVKLLDFGLARQDRIPESENTTAKISHSGTILGTPGYMSPEQVRGEPVDARSDLFSLGLILHEMASGKPAFRGGSSVEIMNSILHDEPAELPPASPPALDRMVRRCLEKQPAMRFQCAADLSFALASIPLSQAAAIAVTRRGAWWKSAAAVVAAIAVAAAAYWLGVRTARPPALPESTLRRLTNDPGLTTDAAISPDGRLVAYSSNRADSSHFDLWVQQVDGGGEVRITDDASSPGPSEPSFSPDATQVAFRSERDGGGIYIAPAIGGEARLIVPRGHRPRFSPDGKRIMYWTGPLPNDVRGSSDDKVWVRLIAGGEATQIGAGCRLFPTTPVWSPDGSRILFLGNCGSDVDARDKQPENYGLAAWVATIDGKDLKPNRELYGFWRSIHHPPVIDQWIGNPSRLLVPLNDGDAGVMTAVPVSDDGTRVSGRSQRLAFAGGMASRISASASGRIVLSTMTAPLHIWTMPIDSHGMAAGPPKQLTYGPAGEFKPSLSADGKKLAFVSLRANGERLFYKDLATGREKEASTEGYRYDTPVFNHDGSKIMCVQYPKPDSWRDSVFEITILGGFSRKVWDKATWSWLYDWSPDNSTLLLLFGGGSEHHGVQELDVASGATTTLFAPDAEDLQSAHFSQDGRWVVFTSTPWMQFSALPSRSRIFIAPFRKSLVPRSEWIPVTRNDVDLNPYFSHDGKLIFFSSQRGGSLGVWAQRLRADMHPDGAPFTVFHSHEITRAVWGGVQAGPHAIVFGRDEDSGNIWLLEPAKHDAP
jgi:eukaryotic-like serine/threonine-protein kinase